MSGNGFSNQNLVVDSDLTYDSGTWLFDGKSLQVNGNMHHNGGTLNLENGKVMVEGAYYHQGGTLILGTGTAEVGGSYYMGEKKSDGTISMWSGEIKMSNEEDLLKVSGDFYMYCNQGDHIQWTAGTTEIGGNLYRYHNSGYNTGISGSHKTVFTGTEDAIISSSGGNQLDLAHVEVKNAESRKLTLAGDIGLSGSLTGDSDAVTITAQDAVLSGNGFSDQDLVVDSDLTYDSGTWQLNGKSLRVNGDVYQKSGVLELTGGSVEVGGSYYMGEKKSDGTISMWSGEIKMSNEEDLLKVSGDFYMYCNQGDHIQWTAGTTEIGGNLYRYHNSGYNTGISGSHKTVFTGTKDPIISSSGGNQLDLAHVEIKNAGTRKLTLTGDIGISGSLTGDSKTVTISAQDAVLSGNGFSNQNFVVDSDLTYDSGTWQLNGKSLKVNGDVYQKGGILNLGKGSLEVTGSYNHQGGTLNPSGGSVEIGENYYNVMFAIDSSSGDPIYQITSGILYMTNSASLMNVAGDFIMASNQSHSGKLTDGTIAIQGDFTQISGNNYNFACSENMTVILNGDEIQNVSFESENSRFNVLQITKDRESGYVFSPDPCWNELEEIRDKFAILIQPQDCAAIDGGEAVFTVKVSGEGLSYQWQYCEPEGNSWKDIEEEEGCEDTLTIPVMAEMDGQKYRCVIKNNAGESLVTEEAVLNVKYELTILQQPEDFTGEEGETAVFTVLAAGYQVTYQWQYRNGESQEWRNSTMAGSRSSTLVVPVIKERNGQEYRCVLTDGDGNMIATQEAELQIKLENPFTDVPQGEYYYDAVLWAYENGIASGLTANAFGPDEACTRAQVVVFLWRAKGEPKAENNELPFSDIEKGSYYYDAVAWAYENGIVSGIDSSRFGPEETVTRSQFVTFLYRAEGKPGHNSSNPFTDVPQGGYYYDAVIWAYENGIASGLTGNRFGTDESCTRGQVATFLYRAYR